MPLNRGSDSGLLQGSLMITLGLHVHERVACEKTEIHAQSGRRSSGNIAGLSAPFDVEMTCRTWARVPVQVTINGYPFRSSLMPMAGCHGMLVNREMREGAGVKEGDTVKVVMERDDAARTVDPPALLK